VGLTSSRPRGLYPHLFVLGADAACDFYRRGFGASELLRNTLGDGTVLFIELAIGDGRLLISEETPALRALAPPTIGGSPVMLYIEVDDVDSVFQSALEAGAETEIPVQEMFWGERYGVLRDPFGHRWAISTAREQLTPEDIARRSPPSVDQAAGST
jgi:PhnB protein